MSSLILVRHGETEWSLSGRHTGRTDLPLTAHGEKQAMALAPWFERRTVLQTFVSPLLRARRTAALSGLPASGTTNVEPDLQEWDYGGYEGRTKVDIQKTRPSWNLWTDGVPPGEAPHPGESIDEVAARLDRVVLRVKDLMAAFRQNDERDGDIVLVAHGHALRMFTTRWLGLPPAAGAQFRLDPASISVLALDGSLGVLSTWNYRPGANGN